MQRLSYKALQLTVAIATYAGAASANASVAEFYNGKSVSVIISVSPGGGYDVLARTVARHMQKHVPGQPNFVPRNMPGAGGIVAAMYLYTSAPRDGSVMGITQNTTPLEPLLGSPAANFDPTKFNWIGTPSLETGLLISWHTSPFKTFEDVKRIEMTAGASGTNSGPAFYSRLLNELLGAKIKVIAGYPGQNEAFIAMERGEVDTYGVTFWSSLTSARPKWLEDNQVRILLQYGPVREEALKGVPYGPDLVKSPEDKLLFEAAYGSLSLGRPFFMPPEVPADRVKAMREGFMAMLADKEFLTEAARLGLQADNPRTGEQLQAEVERLYRMPPQVIERLRRIAQAK